MSLNNENGVLYIVATPIGNLSDISLRALEILKHVDLIAAEDTRHSKKLLQHYSITTKLISLHNFNEAKRSEALLQQLNQGKNIALISDAGTPLISDPGYVLVAKVRAANIQVVPVPGACAAIAALSAAGLSTEKFIFEGFLPTKKSALITRLENFIHEERTVIFYEAPHRIKQLIDTMLEVFGNERFAVIAKELTKAFETIVSSNLADLQSWLEVDANHQRGEFVVLLAGVEKVSNKFAIVISEEAQRIFNILKAELPHKQAAKLTAEITGENKNQIYKMGIK